MRLRRLHFNHWPTTRLLGLPFEPTSGAAHAGSARRHNRNVRLFGQVCVMSIMGDVGTSSNGGVSPTEADGEAQPETKPPGSHLDATVPPTLGSVAELIDFEESLDPGLRWAFRGQPRDYGTLVPSFRRQFSRQSVGAAQLIERRLIDTFREHYANLTGAGQAAYGMPEPNRINEGFDLRCLSVMQHYEIPTRLLDWTSSFWTAVYFASSSDTGATAEIWYYDREIFQAQLRAQPELGSLVDTSINAPHEPAVLAWRGEKRLIEVDVQITPRMTQQKGHHTVCADVFADHAPLFALLPTNIPENVDDDMFQDQAEPLKRLLIDAACKAKALQFLAEHKKITASTIFPDVVGLGRFLRWQFEALRTMML
jgi:hypothetical protein